MYGIYISKQCQLAVSLPVYQANMRTPFLDYYRGVSSKESNSQVILTDGRYPCFRPADCRADPALPILDGASTPRDGTSD